MSETDGILAAGGLSKLLGRLRDRADPSDDSEDADSGSLMVDFVETVRGGSAIVAVFVAKLEPTRAVS